MKKSIMHRSLYMKFVFIMSVISLAACSTKSAFMDYRPPHESLDVEFISTITPISWQPIQADPEDVNLFYLPDGVTMARLNFKGIVNSAELDTYLNGILVRLLEHSPVSGVQAKVQLIGDDDYGQIQATPDGIIILPLRFLQASETEDEIAWLLAHELSHIILTHHDSDWLGRYHQKLNSSLGEAILTTKKYMDIASEFGADVDTGGLETVMTVYTSSMLIHDIASGSLFPAWKRAEEDEADLLAIDLCNRAGFSIDEADRVLAKLGQWAESSEIKQQTFMDLFEQGLNNEADTFNDPEKISEIDNEGGWEAYGIQFGKKLLENTTQGVQQETAKTHRNIAQRQENLLAYTDKFYAQIEIDPDMENWQEQLSKTKNKTLFLAYKAAWDAQIALDKNDLKSAYPLIRKALSTDRRLNNQSYPRWVFYRIRDQQKKKKLATQNLKIALKASDPSETIYKAYIVEKMAQGNYKEAKKVLDRAWVDFKKPPVMLPFQIRINKLAKDDKAVEKHYSQCLKMVISKEIKQQCEQEYIK